MRPELPPKARVVVIGSGIIGAGIACYLIQQGVCDVLLLGKGFQHAPSTGRVVAELIVKGKAETKNIHPLRPTRFRENDLIREPMTEFRD